MTIEDAEIIFGKRWDEWAMTETVEFIQSLDPEDLRVPPTLNYALTYPEALSEKTRAWLLLRMQESRIPPQLRSN